MAPRWPRVLPPLLALLLSGSVRAADDGPTVEHVDLALAHGAVTLHARAVSTRSVLEQLAREARFQLVGAGELSTMPRGCRVDQMPLRDFLDWLLREENVSFVIGQEAGTGTVRSVVIVARRPKLPAI
ncbi:MAG: hypothetical protein U0807_05200 [Candidatus Binatia bacterium]